MPACLIDSYKLLQPGWMTSRHSKIRLERDKMNLGKPEQNFLSQVSALLETYDTFRQRFRLFYRDNDLIVAAK